MRLFADIIIIILACLTPIMSFADIDSNDAFILSQVLHQQYDDGGFTVVAPMTTLSTLGLDKPEDLVKTKEYVRKGLKVEDAQIDRLLEELIYKNTTPVKLDLKSSPGDGYLIDYDGKFAKYFDDKDAGWDQLYKENPTAHGMTQVSLPAFDKKTGLVLVYKGTQYHWLAGSGFLILYKFTNDKLKEQGRVMLWIS